MGTSEGKKEVKIWSNILGLTKLSLFSVTSQVLDMEEEFKGKHAFIKL